MELQTSNSRSFDDSLTGTPSFSDQTLYPWNWSEEARNIALSPSNSCSSPEYREKSISMAKGRSKADSRISSRRGRPRADVLSFLVQQGIRSGSHIKCSYCNRVFPREKSLQAHLRTHTGERPYLCDHPGCSRRFTQSGQLKTHQRLHTGEQPFKCSTEGCERRFTHANRHCPQHPEASLIRCNRNASRSVPRISALSHEIPRRFQRVNTSSRREERTLPTTSVEHKTKNSGADMKKPKSRKSLIMDDVVGGQNNLNCAVQKQQSHSAGSQDCQHYDKPNENLACNSLRSLESGSKLALKSSTSTLASSPLIPKKHWLQVSRREQEQELAKPISRGNNTNNTLTTSGAMNNKVMNFDEPSTSSSCSQMEWEQSYAASTSALCRKSSNELIQLTNITPPSKQFANLNLNKQSSDMMQQEIKENIKTECAAASETFWPVNKHLKYSASSDMMQQEMKENINAEGAAALETFWPENNHFKYNEAPILQDRQNMINEYNKKTCNKNINEDHITTSIHKYPTSSKPILNETRPTVLMYRASNNIKEKKYKSEVSSPVDCNMEDNNEENVTATEQKIPDELVGAAVALMQLAATTNEMANYRHETIDQCASSVNYY
ncbi:PREDICTED: regulatory protein MIG1-like [Polistes dominula]|uniref:Regulatory protein MIG1-like n=1 Tax=Polistes dominula TaxID=743375 RepID=A0ABM1HX92_POLDO|nr:PREDICTED: regulatory protein MIG1-like [Polistes dominula]